MRAIIVINISVKAITAMIMNPVIMTAIMAARVHQVLVEERSRELSSDRLLDVV